MNQFVVTFDIEQWRRSDNATFDLWKVQWKNMGTSGFSDSNAGWNDLADINSPQAGAGNVALNGHAAASRIEGINLTFDTAWNSGERMAIRFLDTDISGQDHNVAVDNFTFKATANPIPEPSTYA